MDHQALRSRAQLTTLAVCLSLQAACIKGSLDQLASPASLHDMHTILDGMDLPRVVGGIVQGVLDVGRLNLDDEAWDAVLQQTAVAVVDGVTPQLARDFGATSPEVRERLVESVRATLRKLAAQNGPHDPKDVTLALAGAIADGLELPPARREALVAELTVTRPADLDRAVAGPDPFTRLLARNLTLGLLDGLSTMDPEPLHRFLAEERGAFAEGAQDSLRWWKISFWIAALAAGGGLIAVSVQVWRDVKLRRRNTKTLKLLAGVLKARESDPSIRELLNTIADPQDPDAARHLKEFYDRHPELRLDLRDRQPPQP